MIPDETQLLTPTEAAKSKGFSLNHFKYLLAQQGGLNQIIIGNRHIFYDRAQVEAWNPKTQPKKRKTGK